MPPAKRKPATRAKALDTRAKDLGPAGKHLWAELEKSGRQLVGAAGALALEACRCIDRLEELEIALSGGAGRLVSAVLDEVEEMADDGALEIHIHLDVDSLLGEARQQQNTLRATLQALGLTTLEVKKTGGGILDQLGARRAARSGGGSTPSRLQSS